MCLLWGVLDVECLFSMGSIINFWKDEMLDIFDEFNLSKYIHSPYVPPY